MHLLEVLNPVAQQRGLMNSTKINERPGDARRCHGRAHLEAAPTAAMSPSNAPARCSKSGSKTSKSTSTPAATTPRRRPSSGKQERSVTS